MHCHCQAAGPAGSAPHCPVARSLMALGRGGAQTAAAAARSSPAPASAWLRSSPAAYSSDAFAGEMGKERLSHG